MSEVQRRLGPPPQIDRAPNPDGHAREDVTWRYPHLLVSLRATGRIADLVLVDRHYATARGLRVGDTRARAIALYGRHPLFGEDATSLLYLTGFGGISIALKSGIVVSIRLGDLADEY